MRKLFTLIVVLVLTLSSLTGCVDSNSGRNNNGFYVNGLIDRTDYRNYFVIVDGKRYDLDTTLQDILDDGYEVRAGLDLSREVKPNTYYDTVFFIRDGERVFGAQPVNLSDKTLPLSQCTIREYDIKVEWYSNASIVGGLSLGCSRDDVIAVFGESLNPENETFIFYGSGTSNAGIFSFFFDESGNMISAHVFFTKK